MKISFANEIGRLCQPLDIDTRVGDGDLRPGRPAQHLPAYLRPGFAFGGSCLPKDLRALLHLARSTTSTCRCWSARRYTNELVVRELVDEVLDDLPDRDVALLGLSFKPQTDDLRESPYVELAEHAASARASSCASTTRSCGPTLLFGANRRYVEDRLPHLQRLLVRLAGRGALTGAERRRGGVARPGGAWRPSSSAAAAHAVDLVGTLGADDRGAARLPGRELVGLADAGGMRPAERVLIIVQNLPVPFDRRVWLECQALVGAGLRRARSICPKGTGDPAYEELDGVHLYKYRPARPATGAKLAFVVEFLHGFLATLLARRSRCARRARLRRHPGLQPARHLLAARRCSSSRSA